jgi:4-amino-4-deoxychorismate lyase
VESPFRRPLPRDLRLIETFAWRPDAGFVRLALHLARLERTARVFAIPFDRAAVERALAVAHGAEPLRVRLTLGLDGRPEVRVAPLDPGPPVWTVTIAAERLDPDDPWLRVKTTERRHYDRARAALPRGIDEMIFLNRRGEVCEGTIFNIFAEADGGWLTPPLACGLLPGILREEMLEEGRAREAVLTLADLRRRPFFLGNSLRGLCRARLAEG